MLVALAPQLKKGLPEVARSRQRRTTRARCSTTTRARRRAAASAAAPRRRAASRTPRRCGSAGRRRRPSRSPTTTSRCDARVARPSLRSPWRSRSSSQRRWWAKPQRCIECRAKRRAPAARRRTWRRRRRRHGERRMRVKHTHTHTRCHALLPSDENTTLGARAEIRRGSTWRSESVVSAVALPSETRSAATVSCPRFAAHWAGVLPRLSRACASAPAARSALITSSWPLSAARWSAVGLYSVCFARRLTSTPRSKKRRTAPKLPTYAAECSGGPYGHTISSTI